MTDYETTIGLEVHVQLQLRSKLFAPSPYGVGGEPNSRVSVVELGLPGVLPVLNREAVALAIRAGLALGSTIADRTHFDRKNYFYPDLPKGYQISQYDEPLCRGGRVPLGDGRHGELIRIHLEEDAGKTTHAESGSLVDLNRAGCALIEIVGQPDLHAPADAYAFLTELKQILQYAGVSECDMEAGLLRCDANISIRARGATELGNRVEIKNLNSFRNVQRALEYEQRRQRALLANGGVVEQETRLFYPETGNTATMRTKESLEDYRYFPDPDLPPLQIERRWVEAIRQAMPELPAARQERFRRAFGLPEHDVHVLLADRRVGDYFEAVATACEDPKAASNWVMSEVLRYLNETATDIGEFPIPAARLAALIRAQLEDVVSRQAAKKVFAWLLDHPMEPDAAIAQLGLAQIRDRTELGAVIRSVIAANPEPAADFRKGTEKALHALHGLVMRATNGRADPRLAGQLLREQLGEN